MGKHLKQKSAPAPKKKYEKQKKKNVAAKPAPPRKTFLDMIAPGVMKFNPDVYIRDNLYCCVWALKEYPAATEDQAILRHLGEKCGVNIRIYTRIVDAMEENRIIQNATNKNRLSRANTNDTKQMITAEGNLQDVFEMVNAMRKRREPLIHCAVFIELCAPTMQELERLQSEVISELLRSKLNVDRLRLRQQKGYLSTCPQGHNIFGTQFERVLPASSVANLYIYNYSGKTDAHGFYIGKDRYGSNILTDFDQRDEDKTSANVLILGNSGQGKSYLMKLLMVNCREAGKNIISLDVEHEQGELCAALDGCFIDLMGGQYIINVLEPKCWSTGEDEDDPSTPETFKKKTVLSQHLSFLRDFFRAYKDFTDPQIDTIEILLSKLYSRFHISDYKNYDEAAHNLYTPQLLQEVLLGLNSICRGADSHFFNGHTNITSSHFLVFGVKSLLMAGRNIQNAMLFNILSYMSDRLLTEGNTVATLDELYIWLSNPTAIEYIRNCLKRVRKKESAMILASQNLDDFDQPNVREMTKPLFSIPPHQFLFNAGSIDKRSYMDMLQLEESEYDLIRYPQRGVCLYKCGNERYLLEVHAPPHKEALFGTAGGR